MLETNYPLVKVKRKPQDPWEEKPTRTLEHVTGFTPGSTRIEENRYGSRTDKRYKATGFFYPARVDGRWYLVDPEGYLHVHRGVVSVTPGGRGSAVSKEALAARYGSPAAWAAATARMLRAHGFTGMGAWSAVDLFRSAEPRLVYTCIWNFMSSYGKVRGGTYQEPGHTGYPNGCIFVFDPEFETFCDQHARQLAAYADDPYLLGHFSDNEMPLHPDLLDRYLALDPADPGCQAARAWLCERRGTFNTDISDADREDFRGYVVDRYLAITTAAIRKYDPNHLCLGSRFHASEKRSATVFAAAGKYLDAIAVNHYWQWMPDLDWLRSWERWSGRPVIITEWYAKGADTGLPNKSGAGWIVPTQEDRGLFYETFTLGLLESGVCVGWDWFKYMDNDPDDLTTDPSNRDSNKGIVTIRFEPYEPLLQHMAAVNRECYALADHFDAAR